MPESPLARGLLLVFLLTLLGGVYLFSCSQTNQLILDGQRKAARLLESVDDAPSSGDDYVPPVVVEERVLIDHLSPPDPDAPTGEQILARFLRTQPHTRDDKQLAELAKQDLPTREQVVALELQFSEVTDRGLAETAKFPNLALLNLACGKVTDKGLQIVKRLPQLQTLILDQTAVSDVGLAKLPAAKNLKSLSLKALRPSSGKITDQGITHLRKLAHLEKLWINLNPALTCQGLCGATPPLPLKLLDASDTRFGLNGQLSDASFSQLTTLHANNSVLSDDFVSGIENCRKLKSLQIQDNPGITDLAIKTIASLPDLENLSLSRTKATHKNLSLLRGCKNLKQIVALETDITAKNSSGLLPKVVVQTDR